MDYHIKYFKYKQKYNMLKKKLNLNKIQQQYQYTKLNNQPIISNNKYVSLGDQTNKNFKNKNYASTYGELTQEGFNDILLRIKEVNNIKTDKVLTGLNFVDLGSGLGKVPMMAFNAGAKKSMGIEFAKERHDRAVEEYNNLKPSIASGDLDRYKNLKYINGDILNNNELAQFLPYVDIVYISNLCFSDMINNMIGEKLKLLPKDALIFCSKPIINKDNHDSTHIVNFKELPSIYVKQSWSSNQRIYVYIVNQQIV